MSLMRRREFLRRSLLATAGSAAFTSVYAKLNLAQAASLPGGPRLLGSDYRALVCLFLYGGNDCFNMIVPRDAAYNTYAQTRTNWR